MKIELAKEEIIEDSKETFHKLGKVYKQDDCYYMVCCNEAENEYFFLNLYTGMLFDDSSYSSLEEMDSDNFLNEDDILIEAKLVVNK